jgi:glyoxylase-like metal-dependent hydrolase (beta-lactamase superfamily II)
MKVHHLNCGTMDMPGAPMVCHVLLVETGKGLVLVDSGYGSHDCANPGGRVGPVRHFTRPVLHHHETAAHQIEGMGFRREDVRHILITHFDLDHIGGISDFPEAEIHVTAAEAVGAIHAPSRLEKIRYRHRQWAHDPRIVEHDPRGEPWRGFAAAKELAEIAPGIVMISLPGHTRGHACFAVDAGHRWVLHCGDAFYHHGTLHGRSPIPMALRIQEVLVAFDRKRVRDNHARLAELYRRRDPDLFIVCAHDPELYAQAHARPLPGA